MTATLQEAIDCLLKQNDEIEQEYGLRLLINFAVEKENHRDIKQKTKNFTILEQFLTGSNDVFQMLTCWILTNLTADDDENTNTVIAFVPSIKKVLAESGRNTAIMSKALGVLKNLSASEDHLAQLQKYQVLETSVSLLATKNPGPEIATAACDVCRNFVRNEEFQGAFIKANGIGLVIQYLHNASDMQLLESAWLLMSLMAAFEQGNRILLIKEGIFDLFTETLGQQTRYSSAVINAVTDTLNNITIGDDLEEEFLNSGIIPYITNLLYNEDTDIKSTTAGALSNIISDEGIAAAFLESKGADFILNMLRSKEEGVHLNAARVIANLSLNDAARKVLLDSKATEILEQLAKHYQGVQKEENEEEEEGEESIQDVLETALQNMSVPIPAETLKTLNESNEHAQTISKKSQAPVQLSKQTEQAIEKLDVKLQENLVQAVVQDTTDMTETLEVIETLDEASESDSESEDSFLKTKNHRSNAATISIQPAWNDTRTKRALGVASYNSVRNLKQNKPPPSDIAKREKISRELLDTEKYYMKMMKLVIEKYATPLRNAIKAGKPILPQKLITDIFSMFDAVVGINGPFLKSLEPRVTFFNEDTTLGDLLCRFAKTLKLYKSVVIAYDDAAYYYNKCISDPKYKEFQELCKKVENQTHNLFSNFLIAPIQRVPRYILLLEELLKATLKEHNDYGHLVLALDAIRHTAEMLNQEKKVADNAKRVETLRNSLVGSGISEVFRFGRTLVREASLVIYKKKGASKYGYFFLFNDMIVRCTAQKEKFRFEERISLKDVVLQDVPNDHLVQHAFKLIHSGKEDVLVAAGAGEKKDWMDDIENGIKELVSSGGNEPAKKALIKSASTLGSRNSMEVREDTLNSLSGASANPSGASTSSSSMGSFLRTVSTRSGVFRAITRNINRGSIIHHATEGRVTAEEFDFLLQEALHPKEGKNGVQFAENCLTAAVRCGWPAETVPAARVRILSEASLLQRILELATQAKLALHEEIAPSAVSKGAMFARGASAKIYKAMWERKDVVLKVFDVDNISFTQEEFRKETAICCLFSHPHLVSCFGASTKTPDNLFILNEFCAKSALNVLLQKEFSTLDLHRKTEFCVHIARACSYLHSFQLIHRDLKSLNVLVTADYVCKVTDFGTSRALGKEMTTGIGSPQWMAPEVFKHDSYGLPSDVYSFGIIMWECYTGKEPYADMQVFDIPDAVVKGIRPTPVPDIPTDLVKLMNLCTSGDPEKRPAFTQVDGVLSTLLARIVGNKFVSEDE